MPGGVEKLGDMVVVPAGLFLRGTSPQEAQQLGSVFGYHVSWFDGELPQRSVYLPSFRIDRYPVTVAQYKRFCRWTGWPEPNYWSTLPNLKDYFHHPVRELDWHSAMAYAAWKGKRLPTEEEWEKAARGSDGRTFPWGDVFDPAACQWNMNASAAGPGTALIGTHGLGDSPYGVTDMSGNVAEWCADGPGADTAYIKGGGWFTEEIFNLRPAARNLAAFRNIPGHQYGFRCAEDWS